ncbi:DUF1737 domain-containing protein [Breoghania sp. L-A4]|uniref:DUF1737 domain-containing protein n=1 Tax=Breoghania sp. L-A4 TaxID=2304600 RepID=UPI000E35F573|nr:DUF1737 domain-containing protein [Breoghania sp. L-A4]AXS38758.1 DUF1737 domain-containing protein [Breoghania sp. L-A4]
MRLYRFITGPDDSSFCHRVTQALNNGWQLSGSPSLSFDAVRGLTVCGQAVIKEVPGTDYAPDMKLGDY